MARVLANAQPYVVTWPQACSSTPWAKVCESTSHLEAFGSMQTESIPNTYRKVAAGNRDLLCLNTVYVVCEHTSALYATTAEVPVV